MWGSLNRQFNASSSVSKVANETYASEIGGLVNPHNDVAPLERPPKVLGVEILMKATCFGSNCATLSRCGAVDKLESRTMVAKLEA
jgi:hypothetical protein